MHLGSKQSMGLAALIMGSSVFLSRVMGLVRDKVISWQFGAGADTDVYFAAFVVPDFINYLLAGGYVSMTLIPLLSASFAKDEEDGWRFFSCVITWNTLAAAVLILVACLFAPQLARFTMPGFSAEQLERLTLYLRIILPGQLFFLAGSCLTAVLYIRKTFAVPALTPLVYNGCIILGGFCWPLVAPFFQPLAGGGMTGYAIGASLGAVCGAFLLPLYAVAKRKYGGLRYAPKLVHPHFKRYILLALPLMLGQSIVVLDEQLVRIFGSLLAEGTVSQLSYARRITLVPVGVVAQAAGVASFPFLAALAANNDTLMFNRTLSLALRRGLFVMLPITAWMVVAAEPIMGVIFEGGRFGQAQTAASAILLRIFLLALPFWLVQQVLARAFFAWQDTLSPAALGTLVTLAALPVYWFVTPQLGAWALAVVSAASIAVYALALVMWWSHRFTAEAFRGTLLPVALCALIASSAALTAHVAQQAALPLLPLAALQSSLLASFPTYGTLFASLLEHSLTLGLSFTVFASVYVLLTFFTLRQALRLRG